MVRNAQDRAKLFSVPFELSRSRVESALIVGVCEVTGLKFSDDGGAFAATIDRVVPLLGYVDDNVRIVCYCYNMARSDWGDDAVLRMAQALVNKHLTK